MTNLNENLDVFEDEATDETIVDVVEQKPETETKVTEEAETKGETKEDKISEEATPPVAEENKSVPIAALHDERRKAKALKEELEKYKSKYDQDEDAPDPVEDPEGYKQHVRDSMKKELYQGNIERSRDLMMESHSDYAEKEKTFMFLTQYDDNLVSQMNENPDPARFAYEKGKEYMEAQRDKLRTEILAEAKDNTIIEEKEPSQADKRKASALGVPDLTKAAATGSNSQPAEIDNRDDLSSLF